MCSVIWLSLQTAKQLYGEANMLSINSMDQWDRPQLEEFFRSVWVIKNNLSTIQGRVLMQQALRHVHVTLFFDQPSTRTKMSFMHATGFLGMQTYCFDGGASSSASKGESIRDTYRTLGAYSDLLVVRSKDENLVQEMQEKFVSWGYGTRLIQAGGGSEYHPTQALLDLYTLWEAAFLGKSSEITSKSVAIIGDLKFGRAAKSLLRGLQIVGAKKVFLVSKKNLAMPFKNKEAAKNAGLTLEETDSLDAILDEVDVFYIPRMQSEYDTCSDDKSSEKKPQIKSPDFVLSQDSLDQMKQEAHVMSPLPRLQELPEELDADPRSIYWEQEKNGLWVRIALLQLVCKDLLLKNKIEEFAN